MLLNIHFMFHKASNKTLHCKWFIRLGHFFSVPRDCITNGWNHIRTWYLNFAIATLFCRTIIFDVAFSRKIFGSRFHSYWMQKCNMTYFTCFESKHFFLLMHFDSKYIYMDQQPLLAFQKLYLLRWNDKI